MGLSEKLSPHCLDRPRSFNDTRFGINSLLTRIVFPITQDHSLDIFAMGAFKKLAALVLGMLGTATGAIIGAIAVSVLQQDSRIDEAAKMVLRLVGH
jgi:uncharacterized membrane protein